MANYRPQILSTKTKRRSSPVGAKGRAPLQRQPSRRRQPASKKAPLPFRGGQGGGRKAKRSVPTPLPKLRLLLVWFLLLAGMAGLAWRLYQLQIVQAADLQKRARQQQLVGLQPYIPRRTIVDSQGNALATDRLLYTLYVHPKLFKKPPAEVAGQLAAILENQTPPALGEKFKERETGIRLANGLAEETADRLRQLSLDGLDLVPEYSRYYPQQQMAAGIVGYVDRDRQGQAGIESSQRHILEQDLLSFKLRRTALGNILPAYLPKDVLNFDDLQLQLTLDLRLQRAARTALKQQMQKFKAKRGAVIVMDARDGSLLTLACEPTFDPNEYYKSKVELFKNWAISDLYEPGSTFKPLNVAIALDAKAIEPNTVVHDGGAVTIDGWQIFNASKVGYGALSIAKVLQTSSNVGMIQIMQRLPKQDYYRRLQQLELGEKIGSDLPGEVAGHLKPEEVFTSKAIEAATAAFGQGFSLTPLKLVQLHAALANGGKLVTPHVVRGLVDVQGHLHWQPSLPVKTIFSPPTSKAVVEMMETVVSEGTGKPAKIPGYRIGGKTGTAQKAGPRGGYIPNAKITSFVAILPVDAPRYVVLAVVDEPQGGNTFGSTVAAPIVKSVMEALISIQGIPPSK